jgi:hypothetical protein
MDVLKNIIGWLNDLMKVMACLLGISIFAELIFGKFLGTFSVVSNLVAIVGKFGDNGFVGLLAMLLILGFMNKEK